MVSATYKPDSSLPRNDGAAKSTASDAELLSHAAGRMLELTDPAGIYAWAARDLCRITNARFAIVSEYSAADNELICRAFDGCPKTVRTLQNMLHASPLGITLPVFDDEKAGMLEGRLNKLHGGMHQVVLGALPEPACKSVEQMLRTMHFYGMGLTKGRALLGVIVFAVEPEKCDRALVEAFGRQVSLALCRARAEERYAEAQLRLAHIQKGDAIGQLAGGIAHDFNNQLTTILAHASMALDKMPEKPPVRESLKAVQTAARQASVLTGQLLDFCRRQMLEPQKLCLNCMIRGFSSVLQRLIGEDVQLELDLAAEDAVQVYADPAQLQQVLINLALNARDAMPGGGALTFRTSVAGGRDAESENAHSTRYRTRPILTVRDTGCGMNAETLDRIFEPFFTTKPRGRGTGLGLATVFDMVKQMGGSIDVDSSPGAGSSFHISFPETEEDNADAVAETEHYGPLDEGSENILLVEDEPSVRRAMAGILRRVGYNVVEAEHAEEALAVYSNCDHEIDLLLTDVVMPGMNGKQLANRIVAENPDIKVLFASGYAQQVTGEDGVIEGDDCFIAKPFSIGSLARKVRSVLDGPV